MRNALVRSLAALLSTASIAFAADRAAPATADKAERGNAAATAQPRSPAAAQLEALKALAGTWTGKAGEGEKAFDATVEYRVTANGTAVMETLFAGTPHEMVTVYHLDGDELLLTHYCAAGNQPTMRAAPSSDPRTLSFDFVRGTNMKPGEMHMHSAKLVMVDDAHLESEWVSWKDGKPSDTAKFALTRKR
jgi:hypothetical protein